MHAEKTLNKLAELANGNDLAHVDFYVRYRALVTGLLEDLEGREDIHPLPYIKGKLEGLIGWAETLTDLGDNWGRPEHEATQFIFADIGALREHLTEDGRGFNLLEEPIPED